MAETGRLELAEKIAKHFSIDSLDAKLGSDWVLPLLAAHDAEVARKAVEEANKGFRAECKRFHEEGRKCVTCGRIDLDEIDMRIAKARADAFREVMDVVNLHMIHPHSHNDGKTEIKRVHFYDCTPFIGLQIAALADTAAPQTTEGKS